VWLYSADLALRYPVGGGGFALVPYVAGGYGGKTYHWSLNRRSAGTRYDTSFGSTAGGGLEIRPVSSSIGLRIEVLNQRSQFSFFEYAGPHADHEFYRDEAVLHEGVIPGELDRQL
jgi:opacity protein-like surface antigen